METNKKKSYKKPQLQEIKLLPEEAVLTSCKCGIIAAGKCNNVSGGTKATSGTIGS